MCHLDLAVSKAIDLIKESADVTEGQKKAAAQRDRGTRKPLPRKRTRSPIKLFQPAILRKVLARKALRRAQQDARIVFRSFHCMKNDMEDVYP